MEKLDQKKGFYRKSFELREDEVRIFTKDFNSESEYSTDYLNLGVRSYRHAEKKARVWQWMLWLIIGLCLTALSIKGLTGFEIIGNGWIGGFLLLTSLLVLWFKVKQEPAMFHLVGGQEQLEILAAEPNEKEVASFLKEIKERVKKAYREQYLNNKDDVLPEEKRSRIEWLHEIKIITRDEKELLLNKIEEEKANGIGFRF